MSMLYGYDFLQDEDTIVDGFRLDNTHEHAHTYTDRQTETYPHTHAQVVKSTSSG